MYDTDSSGAAGTRAMSGTAGGAPDWSWTVAFQNLEHELELTFALVCTDVPVGSKVALGCEQTGPVPPIAIPPTMVTTGPSFLVGVVSTVPAGWSGSLTLSWYSNGTGTPPPGMQIQLQARYVAPPSAEVPGSPVRPVAGTALPM